MEFDLGVNKQCSDGIDAFLHHNMPSMRRISPLGLILLQLCRLYRFKVERNSKRFIIHGQDATKNMGWMRPRMWSGCDQECGQGVTKNVVRMRPRMLTGCDQESGTDATKNVDMMRPRMWDGCDLMWTVCDKNVGRMQPRMWD